MIILYQFPPMWGLPNASPFCMKLETYLRMAALPYEVHYVRDPRTAPKGKLPYIRKDNHPHADSELIIDYLKTKFGDSLDNHLSPKQKSEMLFLESYFADKLYWLMVYFRWQDEAGWAHIQKDYFHFLPFFKRIILSKVIRGKMLKMLYLQGTGRFEHSEIIHLAEKILESLSLYLGLDSYFMGATPSSIDATAFGFLANIAWFPYEDPLRTLLHKHQNLMEFCDRMWSVYFAEKQQPFKIVA